VANYKAKHEVASIVNGQLVESLEYVKNGNSVVTFSFDDETVLAMAKAQGHEGDLQSSIEFLKLEAV
jgi:hypothetical protein